MNIGPKSKITENVQLLAFVILKGMGLESTLIGSPRWKLPYLYE